MDKSLKILFIFFILVLFPLAEITRFYIGNNVAFTATDAGVSLLGGLWVLQFFGKIKKKKYELAKPLLLFIIICTISLIVNSFILKPQELFVSTLYLIRWTFYASLYFVVTSFDEKFKKFSIFLLLIVGSIVLGGGYLQYFFYPALRNLYYLGWDEHLYRMFGSFFDPNFLGTFLVLYFLLIFFLSTSSSQKIVLGFLGFLGILTLIAIRLTYSRSAYIVLFVGMGTLIVFFFLHKDWKRILLSIIVLCFFVLLIVAVTARKSEGTNLFRINSTKARVGSSQNALIIFQKNPIFGVGFNAYRYAQERYGFIKGITAIEDHSGAGADNSFLFVLATTGIIGFIAFGYMWFSILKNVYSKMKENPIAIVVFCSSLGLFVNSFFINSLLYPFIMAWMWILIGLTEKTSL